MLKLHRNARENGVRAAACRGLGFIVKYLDSNNVRLPCVVRPSQTVAELFIASSFAAENCVRRAE